VKQSPVDFLAADGHKWLLGPEGAGLFYLRQEHLERLRPVGLGWNSVVQAGDFTDTSLKLKPSAERYEGGTPNTGGYAALGESLKLLLSVGVDRISERLFEVTEQICNRLRTLGADIASDRDASRRSGIVAFTLAGQDPAAVKKRCKSRGVVLNQRAGRIRVSPHVYTNEDDLERLFSL
jgi:selenocysteine lyase/cysteine desulfurase